MTESAHTDRLPITENDETIQQALEDASCPALLMSMIHMTGAPVSSAAISGRRGSSSARSRASCPWRTRRPYGGGRSR